jgi:hypothetical protein
MKQSCEREQNIKGYLSSDCSLKLENMKLESLVIVDQHATVNLFLGLVHTACHARGVGLTKSKLKDKLFFYIYKLYLIIFQKKNVIFYLS